MPAILEEHVHGQRRIHRGIFPDDSSRGVHGIDSSDSGIDDESAGENAGHAIAFKAKAGRPRNHSAAQTNRANLAAPGSVEKVLIDGGGNSADLLVSVWTAPGSPLLRARAIDGKDVLFVVGDVDCAVGSDRWAGHHWTGFKLPF